MLMKMLIAAGAGLMVTAGGTMLAPAQAAEWRLDPSRCPDLIEDRRDSRVDRGRADRREDRRDRRVTNCPSSAYVYVDDRGRRYDSYDRYDRYERNYRSDRRKDRRARRHAPRYSSIYIDSRGRYYGRLNGRNVRIQIVGR